MSFPLQVDGCKTRKLSEGLFLVPRAKEESLNELARKFPRLGRKPVFYDLKAFPKYVDDLRPYFENSEIILVGKGPSLETYYPAPGAKHLFINDSVAYFPVTDMTSTLGYVIVQDRLPIPYPSELIITTAARKNLHPNSFLIIPEIYGLHHAAPTAVLAINTLKSFNVSKIILVGFDAFKSGDTSYARGFSHKGLNPKRFLTFNKEIEEALKNVNYTFY